MDEFSFRKQQLSKKNVRKYFEDGRKKSHTVWLSTKAHYSREKCNFYIKMTVAEVIRSSDAVVWMRDCRRIDRAQYVFQMRNNCYCALFNFKID